MRRNKIAIVIDDDKVIRKTLSKMLGKLGFKPKVYSSALDLLNTPEEETLFKNNAPELLIIDIVLPGMSGVEFLQDIKAKGYKLNKVALMSGHFWGDDLKNKAEELNCKHFEKPFSLEDLKEWLGEK